MKGLNDLPVLILAYNRFNKFLRCINTLHFQGVSNIYISIDGPKNNSDIKNQILIKRFCQENKLGIKNLKVNFFLKNNGCRLGPIKGITWFFKENNYGVVLEDDVVISKNCLQSFSDLLQTYKNDSKFMSLSSFNEYCKNDIKGLYSVPVWRSWGWASWADKWNEHLEFSKKIKKYSLIRLYNLLPEELKSIDTVNIIKSCQLNLLDAWDYEFNFTHIVKDYKSLTIGGINNYVYGFDESATHTLDIDSLGIDFSLYKESLIDHSKQIVLDYKSAKSILKKCGFPYKDKIRFEELIYIYIKQIYCSFIFRLRVIKKYLQNNP